jgi:hypothetical protein
MIDGWHEHIARSELGGFTGENLPTPTVDRKVATAS